MASSLDFVNYVCEQISGVGEITFKKMFGEYMVYVNAKPILLVCDNTVFVKMTDCIKDEMKNAEAGAPYSGAKPHYILDIGNADLCRQIIMKLEAVTPVPIKKSRKNLK